MKTWNRTRKSDPVWSKRNSSCLTALNLLQICLFLPSNLKHWFFLILKPAGWTGIQHQLSWISSLPVAHLLSLHNHVSHFLNNKSLYIHPIGYVCLRTQTNTSMFRKFENHKIDFVSLRIQNNCIVYYCKNHLH